MKRISHITGVVVVLAAAYFGAAALNGIMHQLSEKQLNTVMDISGIAILMAVLVLIIFVLALTFSKDNN
jgi:predicted PurR-regulated permease PerM